MHWGDDVLLLYLAPFFKPHSPKCGNPTLGVKANRSVAAAKRMNWKWSSVRSDCAFGDMKGVLDVEPKSKVYSTQDSKILCFVNCFWDFSLLKSGSLIFNPSGFDLGRVDCIKGSIDALCTDSPPPPPPKLKNRSKSHGPSTWQSTRVGWKVHRLTKTELCHSNETRDAIKLNLSWYYSLAKYIYRQSDLGYLATSGPTPIRIYFK